MGFLALFAPLIEASRLSPELLFLLLLLLLLFLKLPLFG
jgi:hypothetical protein